MDNFVDERDYRLLEKERYTFFVLRRIIDGQCALLLTDHARLMLCYSSAPYPVWLWTAEDATAQEMERAYALLRENGLLTPGQRFNVKYDLAAYLMGRAKKDGLTLRIQTNMLAYVCAEPRPPQMLADGACRRCTMEDLDEMTEFRALFHDETGIDQNTRENDRRQAEEAIREGRAFFWKNAEGRNVAVCNVRLNGDLASVGAVYTRTAYRRRHYAENLVYCVTKGLKDAGCTPTLYTDADYIASNACYQKIGYTLVGKLCTIGL